MACVRDITERRRAQAQSARLAAVVSSSHGATIAKTLEGIITDWNPAAERMYGYSAAKVIGRPIWMLIAHEAQRYSWRTSSRVSVMVGGSWST